MKNSIIYAFRKIFRNKVVSGVNVVGLSIGIACCTLIYLYVSQEFTYDNFHTNKKQIFRICYTTSETNGEDYNGSLHPFELADALKENVPQVQNSTAYKFTSDVAVKYDNQIFRENITFANPDFFEIFDFKSIAGDQTKYLTNPNEIIITRDLAKKLAKSDKNIESLIGQSICIPDQLGEKAFMISGILADFPKKSSLKSSMFLPLSNHDNFRQWGNDFGNFNLYVKTDNKADYSQVSKNVFNYVKTYYANTISYLQKENVLVNSENCFQTYLQPFKDVYFDTTYGAGGYKKTGNKTYPIILSIIGCLVLLIACCNYILLSYGNSLKKTNEFGIRASLGAGKFELFRLFLTETGLLVFSSIVLGLIIGEISLPFFERLIRTDLGTSTLGRVELYPFITVIYLLLVLFSGFVLSKSYSGKKLTQLLSKKVNLNKNKKTSLGFVTVQFTIAIVLIAATITIIKQTHYMRNSELGFSSNNILSVPLDDFDDMHSKAFKEKLLKNNNITSACYCDRDFISGYSTYGMQKDNGENVSVNFIRIDNDYIPTLDIQLTQGANFTEQNLKGNDGDIIVNEQFLKSFNIKDNPVGKLIYSSGINEELGIPNLRIIGVVKDFHFQSMKDEVKSLALIANTNYECNNYLLVKVNPAAIAQTTDFMKGVWEEFVPDKDLRTSYWDKQLEDRYGNEEHQSKTVGYMSILAILITALGLFGLTLLIMNNRTKEIGVRKVNGAKISEVMVLLNRDFVKWVAIAFIIATPIAWYAMHKWLENFAYKTTLSWWIFALAGVLALGIALLTVSWQSWKAATRNPVEALRYE